MSEETGPLGGLPPADRTLLARAPLQLALAEVRFLGPGGTLPPDVGLRLREHMTASGYRLPRLEQAHEQQVSLNVGPGVIAAPQIQQSSSGWQLGSADGQLLVTLMPSAIVVQTAKYERWSVSLRPVLEAALGAARELIQATVVARIGLRYVDRFADASATTPTAWKSKIDEHLLGPICNSTFGNLVVSAQQQVELRLGDAQGAMLRHGPFADPAAGNNISYLLDLDVFDSEPTAFDLMDIIHRAERLNRTAATLFQSAMHPDFLKSLQGDSRKTESASTQEDLNNTHAASL